ncbi:MAG: hypothetical protein Q8903_10520, partial [Bacteroidota bacterium]|nr:hypothetical protein [Bacteroidota bacterium]
DHGKIIKSGEAGTVLGKASEDAAQKIPAKITSVNGSELSIIYSEENKAEKPEFQPGEEIYIIKKPLV